VGERQAFERLYRRHAPYVLALTVRMQGNATDAEDVVHDAFMKVSSRLGELRNGDSFRFWLAKVAANLVRTRLRKRRLLGVLGLFDSDPIDLDLLVAPEAGPEQRVQLAQIYESLADVSVDQRLAWVLRYVEGHKLEEVAELRGCSLATAKRWIAAAQERISADVVRGEVVRGETPSGDIGNKNVSGGEAGVRS
jgi:RNA polymerase sigma-70 factor (ECF subfamily)